jgi:HD-GYP domain-containing protein (c-di-GMP phosphodiesterase class II)
MMMIFESAGFLIGISGATIPLWLYKSEKDKRKKLNLEYNIIVAQTLGHAAALRDHETGIHNYRVTYIASMFGEEIGLDRTSLQDLMKGAFLHDVGKIGIPDLVLLKNGSLDDEQWAVMKTHAKLGIEIVKSMHWFKNSLPVILHHHEKFDGSGYPDGLKGEEIPYLARIFTLIDVFDALVSKRPYKEAFTLDEALKIIEENTPSQFDPKLSDKFIIFARKLHLSIYSKSEEELREMLTKRRKIVFGM